MTAEKQEPIKIDVNDPKGALTFLKVTLESENIQMNGRSFALSNQCLVTLAKLIEENGKLKSELGSLKPTLEKVQDTESK